jgi:hypothetical protein
MGTMPARLVGQIKAEESIYFESRVKFPARLLRNFIKGSKLLLPRSLLRGSSLI